MLYLQIYVYHIYICRREKHKSKDKDKGTFGLVTCYQTFKILQKLKLTFKVFKLYVMRVFFSYKREHTDKSKDQNIQITIFQIDVCCFSTWENPDNFGQ